MSALPGLPYIPLEVVENIIDHLGGHVDSLRSCALTCRGWNRHARYHLVAAIRVRSRGDLYSIRDYFTSNPRMSGFVRSLCMSPATEKNQRCLLKVLPVDLLKLLPNLRRYRIVGVVRHLPNRIAFHSTTLIHTETYLHVEELNLKFQDGPGPRSYYILWDVEDNSRRSDFDADPLGSGDDTAFWGQSCRRPGRARDYGLAASIEVVAQYTSFGFPREQRTIRAVIAASAVDDSVIRTPETSPHGDTSTQEALKPSHLPM